MSTLFFVSGFLLFALLLHVLALWLGARWVRAKHPTLLRALLATLLLFAVTLSLRGIEELALPAEMLNDWAVQLFLLAIAIVIGWWIVGQLLGVSYGRAILAWLPTLIAGATALALALLVMEPYVAGSYVAPSLSNAPAILGRHRVGVCPFCGGPLAIGEPSISRPGSELAISDAVCLRCGKLSSIALADLPTARGPSDHFFVAKYLSPQRWDIAMYRARNGDFHIHRVIGLPGEKIVLDGQKVYVNGVALQPPPELASLTFEPPEFRPATFLGTREKPAELGPDEFFVVGDMSRDSFDSRFDGPVRAADLRGVVTAIYWPPSRFHVFR